MDYEKMWKELKIKLLSNQSDYLRDSLGEDHKVIRNPRNFASRLIARVLIIMEELERGDN